MSLASQQVSKLARSASQRMWAGNHRFFRQTGGHALRLRLAMSRLHCSISLEERAAKEFEGLLTGPPADAFAVSEEVEFLCACLLAVGQSYVDAAYGFAGVGAGTGGGAGEAGDGDSDGGSGAGADAFGQGADDGFTDGSVSGDEVGGDVGEGGLEGVAIDDG